MQVKEFLVTNTLISVFLAVGFYAFFDMRCVESFLAGVLLFNLNFILLGISWGLIIKKKLIALAVSLIVLKYAILGISIYWSMHTTWVDPRWFVGGIANFTLAVLVAGIRERKNVI